MAGVTNAPFRRLCRQFGAAMYVCEMVGARSLVEAHPKTRLLATFPADESPRSIQLYGTDAWSVREAVALLVETESADHIDLNFGCPVPKVTRNGGGAALPWRSHRFAAIVQSAVEASSGVPITVKLRLGIDDRHLTYLESGRIAESMGAAAVTLHARTAAQLYSGTARWEAIARLKETVSIPVLGNGDIWDARDAMAMMDQTGCDGVVIGRGCLGRPWLFSDLQATFAGSDQTTIPRLGQVAATMVAHARLLVGWFGLVGGIRSFRKHPGWYLKGYPAGSDIRARLASVDSLDEIETMCASLDEEAMPQPGSNRMTRGHSRGPQHVKLPAGYLEGVWDEDVSRGEVAVSGG